MSHGFLDITVTPAVRAAQVAEGVPRPYEPGGDAGVARFTRFTEREAAFNAARDSFYMASVSETGWPYIQHRGGPPGFLRVVDIRTLAFADYTGNRQYLTVGNLTGSDRVSLFLMDYANRRRLKILARAEIVPLDTDPRLTAAVVDRGMAQRAERIMRLRLEAFDWNCPQYITERWTMADIEAATDGLRTRLATLEAENAALRARLAESAS